MDKFGIIQDDVTPSRLDRPDEIANDTREIEQAAEQVVVKRCCGKAKCEKDC